MKKILAIIAIVSSLLLGASFAQGDQPPPGGGQGGGQGGGFRRNDPKMQAAFKKYQPVMDLVSTVNLLVDMDKEKAVAITKDQAKNLHQF